MEATCGARRNLRRTSESARASICFDISDSHAHHSLGPLVDHFARESIILAREDELLGNLKRRAKSGVKRNAKPFGLGASSAHKLPSGTFARGAVERADLSRRHARLRRKYTATVQELDALNRKGNIEFQLGWWALQSTSAALAVVQNGIIVICNAKFHALNQQTSGIGWRRLDATSDEIDAQFPTLWTLVCREASVMFASGADSATRTYQNVAKDEYLEADFQRLMGVPAQVAVLVRDLTDRVRSERELDQARQSLLRQERIRAIGELASGVAHDLNNTLHAMGLRLSLIEQDALCQAEQGDNIRALSRIINDAAVVVGRLQEFARQPHDRPLESVDLGATIREAIEIVRTGIEGQSSLDGVPIGIRTELPPLPEVRAFASDLLHVIVNLLLNARDAMPSGGIIQIEGEQRNDKAIIRVLDEGGGIPPEDLGKVFDPFFTTKGSRGTGLGLSMAHGVLTRLGGEISTENRPEGGACFTLSFPIATEASTPRPVRRSSQPPSPHRILLIDDDPDSLEATKMVMQLDGQHVDVALNGALALDQLRSGLHYDLILCDLGMPGMTGWHVAREIRTLSPRTPVYMLTGWAQQIAEEDPRRRWVRGVLIKPMKLEDLRELLAATLGVEGHTGQPGTTLPG